MITDDQVAELFAEANPVPTLHSLDADEIVDVGTTSPPSEGSSGMTTVKTREREKTKRRRPPMAAALAAVLAAVVAVPLLLADGEEPEVAAPTTPEEIAVQTVEDLFAALTRGDVDGAMALMETQVQESPGNRHAVEFFAALPGTKTLSDCTTQEGTGAFTVECTTNYNGPLMQAIGERSVGIFTVEDGLLTTMFNPGSRDATADAFFEYASQTEPAAYDEVCNPESYDVGSVRTQSSGFAFAGACGQLWAQVAEDAAAWVEAGKPPLNREEVALQAVEEFVAALTSGDANGARALMGLEGEDNSTMGQAAGFLAALPGSKTVRDCVAREGLTSVNLACTLTIDGPLFQATGNASERGSFTVEDGLIIRLTPGSRNGADAAFVEYASQTQPETFEQACSPDSYDPGSVRVNSDGYVFTGACGALWAQVAEDAAAWVQAGKPPQSGEEGS